MVIEIIPHTKILEDTGLMKIVGTTMIIWNIARMN